MTTSERKTFRAPYKRGSWPGETRRDTRAWRERNLPTHPLRRVTFASYYADLIDEGKTHEEAIVEAAGWECLWWYYSLAGLIDEDGRPVRGDAAQREHARRFAEYERSVADGAESRAADIGRAYCVFGGLW